MHASAPSSTSKTSWVSVFSTLTCSVIGMVLVAAGTLPLLFLLMLLATASAARTDYLVWAGTILLGCLVIGGWLLAASGWSHSRVGLAAVIVRAMVWASFMAFMGWNVATAVPQGSVPDSQPASIALVGTCGGVAQVSDVVC